MRWGVGEWAEIRAWDSGIRRWLNAAIVPCGCWTRNLGWRGRTVGARKGWMEGLHVASVRELSATRQRRLWRPTDDWELGVMTDGCDGRERMSWRSFPASPRGSPRSPSTAASWRQGCRIPKARDSLEGNAGQRLSASICAFSRLDLLQNSLDFQKEILKNCLSYRLSPLQAHPSPRLSPVLTSSPPTRHTRHENQSVAEPSHKAAAIASQQPTPPICRDRPLSHPQSPPLPSNPPTRLSSKSRHSPHTPTSTPQDHHQTIATAFNPHSRPVPPPIELELDREPAPEPETQPPRTHHFFVPPPHNHRRRQPSRPPPPPQCPKPTSASAKTTRVSTSSRQRCRRSAA